MNRQKSVSRQAAITVCRAAVWMGVFALCSCTPVASNMQRKETLAMAIIVTDKQTSKPLKGAVIHVVGGRNYAITSGSTRANGEFSFVHTFYNRQGSTAFCPTYTVLEIWKEGYKRQLVIMKTADYLHKKDQISLFKEFAVHLSPGRGTEKLNLSRSGNSETP